MPSYFANYIFNKAESQCIQAIATYNAKSRIVSINGIKSSEIILCEDLPKILQSVESEQIQITCQSPTSIATAGIFPKVDSSILAKAIDDLGCTENQYNKIRSKAENCINFAKWVLEEENRIVDKWCLSTTDLGRLGNQYDEYCKVDLGKLDKVDVLMILDALNHKFGLSGAINIRATNQFIFQVQGVNFLISYDNDSHHTKLCKAAPIALDVNNGFISMHEAQDKKIFPTGYYDKELLDELQKVFLVWTKNNYHDHLFIDNLENNELINYYDINFNLSKHSYPAIQDEHKNENSKTKPLAEKVTDVSDEEDETIFEMVEQTNRQTEKEYKEPNHKKMNQELTSSDTEVKNCFSNKSVLKSVLFFGSAIVVGGAILTQYMASEQSLKI